MHSEERVACYRLYAVNCVELARQANQTERRAFLLRMAQAWFRLAEQVAHPNGTRSFDEAGWAETVSSESRTRGAP